MYIDNKVQQYQPTGIYGNEIEGIIDKLGETIANVVIIVLISGIIFTAGILVLREQLNYRRKCQAYQEKFGEILTR